MQDDYITVTITGGWQNNIFGILIRFVNEIQIFQGTADLNPL